MKFKLKKASDLWDSIDEIEINTIEDLKELQNKYEPRDGLVIDFEINSIILYDSYLE